MSNATKSRKRVKAERRVTLGAPTNNVFALHMTIGTGETAQHFGYYVSSVPADFGLGFHFEKFDVEKVEGEPSEYDVNLDLQRGYHSCTCKGNTYCGHCKHVEAVLALIKSGKLAVKTTEPSREPGIEDETVELTEQPSAPRPEPELSAPCPPSKPAKCPYHCGCPLEDHAGTDDDPWAFCPL